MIGGIGDTGRHLDYNINMYTTDDIGDENTVADVTERLVKSRVDGVILFNNDNIDETVESKKKVLSSLKIWLRRLLINI